MINLKQSIENDITFWRALTRNDVFRSYTFQHLLVLVDQPSLKLHSDEGMLPYTQSPSWEVHFQNILIDSFCPWLFESPLDGSKDASIQTQWKNSKVWDCTHTSGISLRLVCTTFTLYLIVVLPSIEYAQILQTNQKSLMDSGSSGKYLL